VAIPKAASVLEPVVPVPPKYIVSVVIAIVVETLPAEIITIVVPIGKSTEVYAGIVIVFAVTVT
jgi:hypothetical protein